MTVFSLLALALAQDRDPPDAPDSAALFERGRAGVREVAGCWVMTGDGRDRWDAGIFGEGERHWVLAGRLVDGAWREFSATPAADNVTPVEEGEKRRSMFGTFPDAEETDEGRTAVLDALSDDVAVEYVEREDTGWRLVRTLKGGDALNNTLSFHFRPDLRPWRWVISVVDPVGVKGERGRARIKRMRIELQAADAGEPLSERFSGSFSRWPFSVDVTAVTNWTAVPC